MSAVQITGEAQLSFSYFSHSLIIQKKKTGQTMQSSNKAHNTIHWDAFHSQEQNSACSTQLSGRDNSLFVYLVQFMLLFDLYNPQFWARTYTFVSGNQCLRAHKGLCCLRWPLYQVCACVSLLSLDTVATYFLWELFVSWLYQSNWLPSCSLSHA